MYNPSIMEKLFGMMFEPVWGKGAGCEARLVPNWPGKKELLAGRDQYLTEHQADTYRLLKTVYPDKKDEHVRQATRLYLEAVYMTESMRKISPLPQVLPFSVGPDFRPCQNALQTSFIAEKRLGKQWFSVEMTVSIDGIFKHLKSLDDQLITFYVNYEGDPVRLVEVICKLKQKALLELDIYYLVGAVHEWAHLLFYQVFARGDRKREYDLARNEFIREMYNSGELTMLQYTNEYYALDSEYKARVWSVGFLRRYFPDSQMINNVKLELDIGRSVRNLRSEKGSKPVTQQAYSVRRHNH